MLNERQKTPGNIFHGFNCGNRSTAKNYLTGRTCMRNVFFDKAQKVELPDKVYREVLKTPFIIISCLYGFLMTGTF